MDISIWKIFLELDQLIPKFRLLLISNNRRPFIYEIHPRMELTACRREQAYFQILEPILNICVHLFFAKDQTLGSRLIQG